MEADQKPLKIHLDHNQKIRIKVNKSKIESMSICKLNYRRKSRKLPICRLHCVILDANKTRLNIFTLHILPFLIKDQGFSIFPLLFR